MFVLGHDFSTTILLSFCQKNVSNIFGEHLFIWESNVWDYTDINYIWTCFSQINVWHFKDTKYIPTFQHAYVKYTTNQIMAQASRMRLKYFFELAPHARHLLVSSELYTDGSIIQLFPRRALKFEDWENLAWSLWSAFHGMWRRAIMLVLFALIIALGFESFDCPRD